MPRWIAAIVLISLAAGAARAEDLKFSGYYKNLLIESETVVPPGQRYTFDVNRLRLKLEGALAKSISLDLQYDNEVLLGNYLRTDQFALQNELPSNQYHKYGSGGDWYGRHRLYRASARFTSGDTDLRIGRQRVAWGTGRFWSPVDLLNPINPIALERDERAGVDGALVEHKVGPLSRIAVAYMPPQAGIDSRAALNWHSNAGGADYSLISGQFGRERMFGGDLATQIGGAGLRGEVTYNNPDSGKTYQRAVLGVDYAFPSTLTLSGELYYNGAGTTDTAQYDFAALFAGRIQNVGKRYVGAYGGYEITPLLKWTNYYVRNFDDRSHFYSPALVYSLRENLDLSIGAQFFSGGAGSEYGTFSDLYYAQVQWFF